MAGRREEQVNHVWKEEGPEDWHSAEEEEGHEEEGDAKGVPQYDKRLQASF